MNSICVIQNTISNNAMCNTKNRNGGRKKMPDHLRTEVITIRLPRWLIQWMRDHEESQGHLMREALVEYYGVRPPSPTPAGVEPKP